MDIRRLDRDISYVCLAGNTLSCEQQVVLYNSLTNLQNENNFTNVYFWGKIFGTESDYFVAYGFRKDILKHKVFFYSTNCIDWGVLPLSTPAVANLSLICQAPFQGDPSLVLNVSKEGFDGFNIDTVELNEELITPLKEEDRLSATVWAVTDAAAVVPRGVFVLNTDDGCLSWNPCFVGLGHSKATELSHYLHLRAPRKPWNTCLLTASTPNPVIDCLDSVDTDFPPGCWSLQVECGSHVAVLRNLLWPGAMGYHAIGTPDHGYVYFGSGKRNLDLPFMV